YGHQEPVEIDCWRPFVLPRRRRRRGGDGGYSSVSAGLGEEVGRVADARGPLAVAPGRGQERLCYAQPHPSPTAQFFTPGAVPRETRRFSVFRRTSRTVSGLSRDRKVHVRIAGWPAPDAGTVPAHRCGERPRAAL